MLLFFRHAVVRCPAALICSLQHLHDATLSFFSGHATIWERFTQVSFSLLTLALARILITANKWQQQRTLPRRVMQKSRTKVSDEKGLPTTPSLQFHATTVSLKITESRPPHYSRALTTPRGRRRQPRRARFQHLCVQVLQEELAKYMQQAEKARAQWVQQLQKVLLLLHCSVLQALVKRTAFWF